MTLGRKRGGLINGPKHHTGHVDSGSRNEGAETHHRHHMERQTAIRAELQVKSILLQFIEEEQLRWYGHVRRMSTSRTTLRWLEWKPNTVWSRGRPRKRWMDNVKKAVEVRGSTLKEIEQSALFLDRSQWKNLVTNRP